jgi:hypothetical protein
MMYVSANEKGCIPQLACSLHCGAAEPDDLRMISCARWWGTFPSR